MTFCRMLILFGIALLISSSASASCLSSDCAGLGYTQSKSDCSGKKYVACPFDISKVFCGQAADVGTTCPDGYDTTAKTCADGQILAAYANQQECSKCTGTPCESGYSTKTTSCSATQNLLTQSTNSSCKKCENKSCPEYGTNISSSCSEDSSINQICMNTTYKDASGTTCKYQTTCVDTATCNTAKTGYYVVNNTISNPTYENFMAYGNNYCDNIAGYHGTLLWIDPQCGNTSKLCLRCDI